MREVIHAPPLLRPRDGRAIIPKREGLALRCAARVGETMHA